MEPFIESLIDYNRDNKLKLTNIMEQLQDHFGNYKYTVYRCAAKIVALQKLLHTRSIPYKLVLAIFERHNIHGKDDINLMVPPFQLTSLVHDIYFACEKFGHFTKITTYQLAYSTSLFTKYIWDVFDPHRRHSISHLELKVTFILMCKQYNSDKIISEFYNLISDRKTGYVSKYSFQYLLKTLIKILTYVGEGNSYGGHNLPTVMQQCFLRHYTSDGLTEHQFHNLWSSTHTRFLIYANLIALIKRIEDTEKLVHNNVCSSCHLDKIIGIRFKCQNCKNLSLCLKCFATGYSNSTHQNGHRMYEVFSEDTPPKKISNYLTKICTMFCNKQRSEEATSFCHSHEVSGTNETEMITFETNRSAVTINNNTAIQLNDNRSSLEPSIAGLSTAASNASEVSERLQSIIDKLLEQNIKLENQLKHIGTSTNEDISKFLNAHQQFLIEIINEMRTFAKSTALSKSYPTASTPNRSLCSENAKVLECYAVPETGNLTHSINGADINRSYLDANKSDYSIKDLSIWFNQRRLSTNARSPLQKPLDILIESELDNGRETEMTNFKLLLHKVKEIVEDSYSDNSELAEATQNLENVLDSIILNEEASRATTEKYYF